MDSKVHFDETNIALLEALRTNVRAPWDRIGAAIGVDGVTARRRWNRIVDNRLAWTTVSTGNLAGQVTAVVTGRCQAGSALEVTRSLSRRPFVVTAETLIGRQDLRCTVVVRDMGALGAFLTEDLSAMSGLLSVETQLVDNVYAQGSNWRAGTLTSVAQKSLNIASDDVRSYTSRPHRLDPSIIELLILDARATAKGLAKRIGVSETLVRRRINALVNSGVLVLRAEAAPHLAGMPFSATVWWSFPARDLEPAAALISRYSEARWTASLTAGPASLISVFWFSEYDRIRVIERQVQEAFPSADVIDRSMQLKPVKRMMHILDEEGLTVEVLPWVPQKDVTPRLR